MKESEETGKCLRREILFYEYKLEGSERRKRKMKKDNVVGIVATIKKKPHMVIDAEDWKERVYQTEIERERQNGGKTDTFILQYNGAAAGTEDALEEFSEGTEILVCGEVRSRNRKKKEEWESRTVIYIFAETILKNDPPAEQKNEVFLRGRICKEPRTQKVLRKNHGQEEEVQITEIVVAVNVKSGAHYIPCACWRENAELAAGLNVGTCVEVKGRMRTREITKRIKGKEIPFLTRNYEVSVYDLKCKE